MTNKRGFTLVELIVVVTILAILGTIGFVSYSSYLTGVRDANRTTVLQAISDGLNLYSTTGNNLPIPDNENTISTGATAVAYQGEAGVTVLETIEYTKQGLDPKDKASFVYLLSGNKKYHQLSAFLEDSDNLQAYNNLFPQAHAAVDYSLRYLTSHGNKLGVLVLTADQTPLSADVDINSASTYTAIFSDNITENNVDAEAYINTIEFGGILPSCEILQAKQNLTATGTYLFYGTGAIPAVTSATDNCGPAS